jgi:Flp pilus assembly protein TadG
MRKLAANVVCVTWLRRIAVETRGAEIAEAAAVLPLMFMILLGIFWFGQAFSIYSAITRAAQEGARAGAAPICTTCGAALSPASRAANADAAVQAALTIAKLDPTKARQPSPVPSFT